jgi:hypothetical protein
MVLGIATAALSAATMARTTVLAHQSAGEAESRLRVLLTDMLQHAPAADAVSEPLLRIERDASGVSLVFLSTGVIEPFGTGPVWRVRVAKGENGLQVDATPINGGGAGAIHATASSVRGFDLRVLESARTGEAARWRSDWPIANARPQVVALTFSDDERASATGGSADAGTSAAFNGTRRVASGPTLNVPLLVTLSPLDGLR